MPGMHNMGGLGKQKVDLNAMQRNLQQRMRGASNKEKEC